MTREKKREKGNKIKGVGGENFVSENYDYIKKGRNRCGLVPTKDRISAGIISL